MNARKRMDEIAAEMAEMIDASHCFGEMDRRRCRNDAMATARYRELALEYRWLSREVDHVPAGDLDDWEYPR